MAGYGYSNVTDKGFTSFLKELSDGEWKGISIKKYDAADQVPSSPLLDAPRTVVWKLRATWAIGGVTGAIGSASPGALARLDGEWDSAQRALNLRLASALEHKDEKHRAAAERLRAALLSGSGAEQTTLRYDQEVDFGDHQVKVASEEPLAADVKTVGIQEHIERIREATAALGAGLGRIPGQNRAPSRSRQLRDALTVCSTAFNAIHEEMDWLLEHTAEGASRDLVKALQAPFLALLERYSVKSGSAASASTPGDTPDAAAPKGP